MSRSGYSDWVDNPQLWRGAVDSAIRGKRGQRFFRDLVTALDALPEKVLVANELTTGDGLRCALGALARFKGATLEPDDTYDYGKLAQTFDIAGALAQETMYQNDEGAPRVLEAPASRWTRMRKWAEDQIRKEPT